MAPVDMNLTLAIKEIMPIECKIDGESFSINFHEVEDEHKPFAPSAANQGRRSPKHQLAPQHFPSSRIDSPSSWARLQFPVALRHIWLDKYHNRVPTTPRPGSRIRGAEQNNKSLWKINKLIDFWCFYLETSRIESSRVSETWIITFESHPAWRPARTFVSLRNSMSRPTVHVIE